MRKSVLFIAVFSAFFPHQLSACLWDYDTLAMERKLFPGAHELIAGNFVRHSDAYYKWRIADRMAKPSDQLLPSDMDDVAVAHDKLGNHDKAIETILEKMERWPDQGRYESEANLGTFYIHAGQLEEGLEHIRSAIAINPDAHFGREIYQQLLVEYLIEKRSESLQLPLSTSVGEGQIGFTAFVLESRKPVEDKRLEEIQAAANGVLGMMRFGTADSPVLLEVLGDLLLADFSNDDAKMLATRAYLRASMKVDDPVATVAYRDKAEATISMQKDLELEQLEEQLFQEIEKGDNLFLRISADEAAWIAADMDVDAEFQEKYFEVPLLSYDPEEDDDEGWVSGLSTAGVVACSCSVVAGLIAIAVVARKRGRGVSSLS
ncbi:tetratricopeptide repeat domain protein [Rhodopirellula europaea]|jgi:tetratricopeptide (TPR) repeat protein|uniref:Tetratricopeptide repeat domain protein n=1 Tax=Rhodopirellula europaea SH398 TaxID=1263868 RepID=M5SNC4_9BACT|nr:tetratricopeptide repeat domain protein [Rhodopirellula europaea]EMI27759.1 tetratricopeptide repeat domain protein [Rhodopirellula europaea SH398]